MGTMNSLAALSSSASLSLVQHQCLVLIGDVVQLKTRLVNPLELQRYHLEG